MRRRARLSCHKGLPPMGCNSISGPCPDLVRHVVALLPVPPVAKPSLLFTLDDLMSSEEQSRVGAARPSAPAITISLKSSLSAAKQHRREEPTADGQGLAAAAARRLSRRESCRRTNRMRLNSKERPRSETTRSEQLNRSKAANSTVKRAS